MTLLDFSVISQVKDCFSHTFSGLLPLQIVTNRRSAINEKYNSMFGATERKNAFIC